MVVSKAPDDHNLPSLSRVFGYIAVKELRLLEDRIRVLAQLGYGNAEIAMICDTSIGTVRTLKSTSKKKKKGAKKGKKKASKKSK